MHPEGATLIEGNASTGDQDNIGNIPIPSQPELLQDVMQEATREDPRQAVIAERIMSDAAMSAAVLKAINSPLFGLRNTISSIRQAISLLGLDTTINIVNGLAIQQGLNAGKALNMPRFWDSANYIARASSAITSRLSLQVTPDEAYTLGLFHDCGIPVLAKRFPEYREIMRAGFAEGLTLIEIEQQSFNTDHATIGYLVSRSWNLPLEIRATIRYHHSPEEILSEHSNANPGVKDMISALLLGIRCEQLTNRRHEDLEWPRNQQLVADHLQYSAYEIDDLLDELQEQVTVS